MVSLLGVRPGTTGDTVPTSVRGWSTRRRVASIAGAVVVFGLYAALLVVGAIDDHGVTPQLLSAGAAAETVVFISVVNVATAALTLDADVVIPAAGLVDQAGRLLDDMSLRLHRPSSRTH